MGTPCDLAHGVSVTLHYGQWPGVGAANVKGANDTVDAGRRDDGVVVLVPVVGKNLGWRAAAAPSQSGGRGARVDRDGGDEVVFGRRGRAQVE